MRYFLVLLYSGVIFISGCQSFSKSKNANRSSKTKLPSDATAIMSGSNLSESDASGDIVSLGNDKSGTNGSQSNPLENALSPSSASSAAGTVPFGQIQCKNTTCYVRHFDVDPVEMKFPNGGWQPIDLPGSGMVQSIASYLRDGIIVHWIVRDDGKFHVILDQILHNHRIVNNTLDISDVFPSGNYVDSLDILKIEGQYWAAAWQDNTAYMAKLDTIVDFYTGPHPDDWIIVPTKKDPNNPYDYGTIPGSGKVRAQTMHKTTSAGIQGFWRESGGYVRRLKLDKNGNYIFPPSHSSEGWASGEISHDAFEPKGEKVTALSLYNRNPFTNLDDFNSIVKMPMHIDNSFNVFNLDVNEDYLCIMARPGDGDPKNGHAIVFSVLKGKYNRLFENPGGGFVGQEVIPRIFYVAYYRYGSDPALYCESLGRDTLSALQWLPESIINPEPFGWKENNCTDYATMIFKTVTGIGLRARVASGIGPMIPGILADTIRNYHPDDDNSVIIKNVRKVLYEKVIELGGHFIDLDPFPL